MAQLASITGVKEVLANIKRQDAALGLKMALGLKAAGLKLQRDSQRLVPVDTGNLKASAFTRSFGSGWSSSVVVGYTASYAVFVHEASMVLKGELRPRNQVVRSSPTGGTHKRGPGYRGHYWDPQGKGQSKFLEEPARTLKIPLRNIVLRYMKI